MNWWQPNLADDVQQGDAFSLVAMSYLKLPVKWVERPAGHADRWSDIAPPSQAPGLQGHIACQAVLRPGLVVGHSEEVRQRNTRAAARMPILVAPFYTIAELRDQDQEALRGQRLFHMIYVSDFPGFGAGGVNLRHIGCLDKSVVIPARVATMSADARLELAARLVGFFTRKDI